MDSVRDRLFTTPTDDWTLPLPEEGSVLPSSRRLNGTFLCLFGEPTLAQHTVSESQGTGTSKMASVMNDTGENNVGGALLDDSKPFSQCSKKAPARIRGCQ